jgi:DNA-binding CsgD family transcriptional regulator
MKNWDISDIKDIFVIPKNIFGCRKIDDLRLFTLTSLQKIFNADKALFVLTNYYAKQIDLRNAARINIEDKFYAEFIEYYHKWSLFCRLFLKLCKRSLPSHDLIFTNTDLISYEDLRRSEYYNDFLAPLGVEHSLIIFVKSCESILAVIGLFRSKKAPPFLHPDKVKAKLVVSYIAGAVENTIISKRITELESIIDFISTDLPYRGIIVLDDSMKPTYVNKDAIKILDSIYQSQKIQGNLSSPVPEKFRRSVREFVNSAFPSKDSEYTMHQFKLGTEILGKGVTIYIRCLTDTEPDRKYLVFLEPREIVLFLDEDMKKYGLTPRELDVICLLFQGLKNVEIADKLYISEHTVENHLKSIYEKTHVRNRTSLLNQFICKLHPFGQKISEAFKI